MASPGSCGSGPCEQWFAHITNHSTDTPDRPEVFFSGAVHGNEQVGPTAVVEFAKLLVENYLEGSNDWLRRLVDTRSIWIMPNANAKGFHDNVREENNIDPNRDFPYGQVPSKCMVRPSLFTAPRSWPLVLDANCPHQSNISRLRACASNSSGLDTGNIVRARPQRAVPRAPLPVGPHFPLRDGGNRVRMGIDGQDHGRA